MQASVTTRLGILDVVLCLHNVNVILHGQHIRQLINVIDKRADNADTGDIVQIFFDALNGNRNMQTIELFVNAHRLFQPRLDAFNRVAVKLIGKLNIKHLELGFNLQHRAGIVTHQPQIIPPLIVQLRKHNIRR